MTDERARTVIYIIIWLAPRVGIPERASRAHLTHSGRLFI